MSSGFQSYHIYNTIRHIYFNSKKTYDILNKPLPRREVLLKKWNEEMIHRKDSLFFFKLDKLFNKEQLIRLFAYYYLENSDFYIYNIFDDDMKLFRVNESNLLLMKDIIETDILTMIYLCIKNNKKIKQIIFSKSGIPIIFKMYEKKQISVYTIIAFQKVYKIIDRINKKSLNVVTEDRVNKYQKIIDKFSPIVYKYYNFDVREHIISCMKQGMLCKA